MKRICRTMPLVLAAGLGGGSAAAEPLKLLPPETGVYHGVFADIPEFPGPGDIESRIARFEAQVGKDVALTIVGDAWVDGITFPSREVAAVHAVGKVPVVHVKPWSQKLRGRGPDLRYSFDRLLRGEFDADLTRYARAAKAANGPIVISFAPEMNGNWYPWSGLYLGADVTNRYGDPRVADGPERYRDAYRRVVNIFRREGVENVTWVFHVASADKPAKPWNDIANYYPGDQYVDWIGVSVYSAQYPGDYWEDFADTMNHAYPRLAALSESKPIAVLEYGIIEDYTLAFRKADWITNALAAVRAGDFPRVKAMAYWHESSWIPTGENNMRVDSSPSALRAYADGIAASEFVSEPVLSRPTDVDCLCGWITHQGINYCAIWKPGDATVREYRRFSQCDLAVCQQLFSRDTVYGYCNGRIRMHR